MVLRQRQAVQVRQYWAEDFTLVPVRLAPRMKCPAARVQYRSSLLRTWPPLQAATAPPAVTLGYPVGILGPTFNCYHIHSYQRLIYMRWRSIYLRRTRHYDASRRAWRGPSFQLAITKCRRFLCSLGMRWAA